jgi:hypothetical protein
MCRSVSRPFQVVFDKKQHLVSEEHIFVNAAYVYWENLLSLLNYIYYKMDPTDIVTMY